MTFIRGKRIFRISVSNTAFLLSELSKFTLIFHCLKLEIPFIFQRGFIGFSASIYFCKKFFAAVFT
nr:MAG TPA: hypothetical protein [Caudoviricetes sp.]